MFLGAYILYGKIWSAPWKLYSTFYIEERHGFNKCTLQLFLKDQLKQLFLLFALLGPLSAAFLWIIIKTGDHFVLYVSVFVIAVSVVMMVVVPLFIMPLFYKFTELPEEHSQLRSQISDIAKKIEFPLKKIQVMDGSTRSSHSNAFVYGFWKIKKKVVLFDNLLKEVGNEKLSDEEITAIVCHELGHWKFSHSLFNFLIVQLYLIF